MTANKKSTILVADDDPRLLRLVQRNLEQAGFRVVTATDGLTAVRLAEAEEPDLLVIDIGMPSLDGREVCRRVRRFTLAPILILTARDSEEDKVSGFEAGADDYLTKPFGVPEFLARVKAALRRARMTAREQTLTPFTVGDLTVDFAQHLALRGGQPVPLTPTEYRIVAYLARNAGKVVTQDELLTKVWGPEYKDEAHLLRVNIARLRQKIEPEPSHPRYVITRPGIGYTMVKELPKPAPAPLEPAVV
jgi:DNA-binding response OmpR family regulator